VIEALVVGNCRHCTAVRVTADDNVGNPECSDRILYCGRDATRLLPVARHDVTGVTNDK
jgi:hypothetical protein